MSSTGFVSASARTLLITLQDGTRRVYSMTGNRVAMGRAADNDLAYPEDAVLSRRHLILERDGNDWFALDQGSKNGSLLNGERLEKRTRLVPGDTLNAGRVTLFYQDPAQTAEQTVVFVHDDYDATISDRSVMTTLDRVVGESSVSDIDSALTTGAIKRSSHVQALLDAGRELAGHRPLHELFEVILDLAMKSVGARRGMLATVEGDKLAVRALRGEGLRISEVVRDRVLAEKSSLLIEDASRDESLRTSTTMWTSKVKSLMAAPLQTKDKVIGIIYVDMNELIRRFTTEDLNLLTVMANVAAIRIEHSRLVEVEQAERMLSNELEQAAEIQRSLLPRAVPRLGSLDVAGQSVPCRSVGGDYFDFLELTGGRFGVIVGDVAGKGMAAALLMSSLQARVQVLSEETQDLALFVTRLNRSVATTCPENRFITFFIAVVDPQTGEFTWSNAGHLPPYVIRASGKIELLRGGGPVLGILKAHKYDALRGCLQHGDTLVLYSDGVTEAFSSDGEEFGEQRFEQALAEMRGLSAREVLDGIQQRVEQFMGAAPTTDDMTIVVVRRP